MKKFYKIILVILLLGVGAFGVNAYQQKISLNSATSFPIDI